MMFITRYLATKGSRFVLIASLFFALELKAQETEKEDESLQELLELNAFNEASELQKQLNESVSVSSKKALSSRETPGIISVVTAAEIKNSGARDLIDVLRMVPGFDFGTDVDFVIGLGVRGNWANEGKVLLMVDGVEYNEILFQSNQFGNRFPVDLIDRIEINRGPGSAIYGGTAEYAVINIITKGNAGFEGVHAAATYGQLKDTYGRKNVALTVAEEVAGIRMDASFFAGKGNRSGGEYAQLFYDPVNLSDGYAIADPLNINAGIKYKGANIRAIYDKYRISSTLYQTDFSFLSLLGTYDIKINEKLSLTPMVSYTNQLPWHYKSNLSEDEEDWFDYKVNASRFKAGVGLSYDVNRKWNFVFGGEYSIDNAEDLLGSDNFGEGVNSISFNNISFYSQGLFKHYWANLTFGFRYDKHNAFGAAFVPRVALTKRIENFHFKLLYSQSFRAPGIENININEDIKPERSSVSELEFGYQFTPEMLLTLNLFSVKTRDVIVYEYEWDTEIESYSNFARGGSRGLEMIYQFKKSNWYTNLTYAFYITDPNNTLEHAQVEENQNLYLAFPAHKVTLNSSFNITKGLSFNPSFVAASKRYAYNEVDENDEAAVNKLEPYLLANIYFNYSTPLKGLEIGIGAYNVFDQDAVFVQPFNGDYAPVPDTGREIVAKLAYTFNSAKSK